MANRGRRHLIKYAAPVVTVELNRAHDGPRAAMPTGGRAVVTEETDRVAAINAERAGHCARLTLAPALPDIAGIADGCVVRSAGTSRWTVHG